MKLMKVNVLEVDLKINKNQNTKIVQDNKRIFILCLLIMIHWIWFR
jgi:hypothetical protein